MDQLTAALVAAIKGEGPNGVLVLGPSGSGKTELVRTCLTQLGCRIEYGNALTVRNRTYFTDMDPQESGGGSIMDFLVPKRSEDVSRKGGGLSSSSSSFSSGGETVLVVDDLDTLANDLNHGLDGLLKLLPPLQKRTSSARRRICVCIASSRHKSDKRLLDLYRRCTEVRVRLPQAWDPNRGAALVPPAAVERATLYPLVHDLLTRPMELCNAASDVHPGHAGLSEPDRVTVGLLFHENVHDYCGATASDATLAAIAHDQATADAIGTLAHQAQTWHMWELCFLLRTFRGNLRLFPRDALPAAPPPPPGLTPSFTKLLTRCSTEAGTRAFLTDMCFRLGCTWHELFPRLAQLDSEYTALVSRPTPPPLLACLRQAGGGARRTSKSNRSAPAPTTVQATAAPQKTTAIARTEWLHRRLSAQLVVSRQARYTPTLALSEVRRMYRCLRAESGSAAASSRKRTAAASSRRADAATRRKRLKKQNAEEPEEEEEEEGEEQDGEELMMREEEEEELPEDDEDEELEEDD